MKNSPLTVGIPTFGRGDRILKTIRKIQECRPKPSEIIVFIDDASVTLRKKILKNFPSIKVILASKRVGPGGGRKQCIKAAKYPFFASFDDDSWPIDPEYFQKCIEIMKKDKRVAVVEASIFHLGQKKPSKKNIEQDQTSFTGCGHIMRVSAYHSVSGYIDRPWAYGLEEKDVALQLICTGWKILKTSYLRVFHETKLKHHSKEEITQAIIENAALLPWLRYPILLWPIGIIQYLNVVIFQIKKKRWQGILSGLLYSPLEIWKHRNERKPLSAVSLISYFVKKKV